MSRTQKRVIAIVAFLFFAALFGIFQISRQTLAEEDPEYVAIEKTLRLYLAIEAEARYTLDDSRLSEVLADDWRGGSVSQYDVQLVRFMTNQPNLWAGRIGFLEVNRARYAYDRLIKSKYDEAVARGILPVLPTEEPEKPLPLEPGKATPTPTITPPCCAPHSPNEFLRFLPGIKDLESASGRGAYLPHPKPEKVTLEPFVIQSIRIDILYKDLAYVVGESSLFIFAKIDGRWYLIGSRHIGYGG